MGLEKFVGSGAGLSVKAPEVKKPKLAEVLKHNPYHDEAGRFSTQNKAKFVSTSGVFASRLGKLRGAGASKTYTREEIDADLESLSKMGVRAGEGVADHFLEHYPGVKPSDVVGVMGSGGEVTSGRMRIKLRGQLNVSLETEIAPGYPPKSYQISRDFDPVAKSVYHDYLSLSASAQGAGTVKQVFRESLPLYDKMGMKSIDVFANIDGGGYAWGRYGFDQKGTEFRSAASKGLSELTNKLGNRRLSTEAWAEHAAVSEILSGPLGKEPSLPRVFTSLKTPNLDAELSGISGAKSGSFLKTILHNQNWNGTLSLTDKEQRAYLNDYIRKR